MISLFEKYTTTLKDISTDFAIKNLYSSPSLSKITVFISLGSDGLDKKKLDNLYKDLQALVGSKPIINNAKFSNAALKIREGQPISILATLRGQSMMNFLTKLIYVALPRLRDFKGLKSNFDSRGNVTITIPGDSSVFYEANPSRDISIAFDIKRSNKAISLALLSRLGLPFNS